MKSVWGGGRRKGRQKDPCCIGEGCCVSPHLFCCSSCPLHTERGKGGLLWGGGTLQSCSVGTKDKAETWDDIWQPGNSTSWYFMKYRGILMERWKGESGELPGVHRPASLGSTVQQQKPGRWPQHACCGTCPYTDTYRLGRSSLHYKGPAY